MARRCSTICLPICKDDYLRIIGSPAHFRLWVDQAFRNSPELFPEAFARGYTLKDFRTSKRLGIRTRRIRLKATKQAFSVRPSFAFPSMWEWAKGQVSTAWVLEQVKKLCSRAREYGEAYRQAGGHRTSNMLDRVMRGMNRYFEDGQHLHGGEEAVERHCRSWALLFNFRPWHPATARANGGWRSPAERVNKHRYHDNWLHNLLVSASLAGFRR